VLSFEAIIGWPAAIYFYLVHADWSWMYRVDPASLPRGVLPLVLAAELVAMLAGYLGGWALVRRRGERALHLALGITFLLLLIGVAIHRSRIVVYGSYGAFRRHEALVPLGQVKLAWSLAGIGAGVLGAAAAVAWTLYTQGRRNAKAAPARAATETSGSTASFS
jgi:hypothetical protein